MRMPGIRLRPKECLVAFCDEASHNREQFFVIGAVYFALKDVTQCPETLANIEKQLKELKEKSGLFGRLKWVKLPTKPGKYFDGYKEVIQSFLETDNVQFKCLVIDTNKYPLNNLVRWAGDALIGYQKFYCVFLADGLMQRYPGYFYHVVFDEFSGVTADSLERAIEGRYIRKVKPQGAAYHCKVRAGDENHSGLLQLVDLLVGAVGFAWNGGNERKSPRAKMRAEIVSWLEKELKTKLSEGTAWSSQKFNIWEFKAD
jgi:hypothetical protein